MDQVTSTEIDRENDGARLQITLIYRLSCKKPAAVCKQVKAAWGEIDEDAFSISPILRESPIMEFSLDFVLQPK
jgi:hypothetical protein